jgi:hypothetical protein
MLRRNLVLAMGPFLSLSLSLTASAASIPSHLIDVNFTGSNNPSEGPGPAATGAAVIGAAGDVWNGLASTPPTAQPAALVASNGVASGASITWTSNGSWNAASSPSPNPALTEAYLYQTSGSGSVDISGLDPNHTYQLYLYTQNNDGNDRQSDFTVTNGTGTATAQSGDGSQGKSAWLLGTNYTEVTVSPNSHGQIDISFAPQSGEADFNGLQLFDTSTPEPSSLVALLGLGAMGLFIAARRRRNR